MRDKGDALQVMGCIIASLGIFLPSALLVLFFYPIWHNLKKYASVYRALEGINAVVVGIMLAATFYMVKDVPVDNMQSLAGDILVIACTWAALMFSRLPSPVIVICCLGLGALV